MYKFSKFDNYSLQNLALSQVWCNHFETFNDPFECWCIEKIGIPDSKTEKERYDNIVAAWGYDPGHDNFEEFVEYCSEFDHQHSMRVSHYLDSARLSCFCKSSDNLLMWSHYADGLRGFCVEFEKEKLSDNSEDTGIYNVVYQEAPPVVDTMLYEVANDQVWYHEMAIEEEESKMIHFKNHVPDALLSEYHLALSEANKLLLDLYFKMLCYKPLEWKYEEEIRLILHTNSEEKNGMPFKYQKEAIKSVIIGERASDNNVQQLRSVLKDAGLKIPVKIAKRDRLNYQVIVTDEM